MQELRRLNCCLRSWLPLWQSSPRTCLPQIYQASVWSEQNWSTLTGRQTTVYFWVCRQQLLPSHCNLSPDPPGCLCVAKWVLCQGLSALDSAVSLGLLLGHQLPLLTLAKSNLTVLELFCQFPVSFPWELFHICVHHICVCIYIYIHIHIYYYCYIVMKLNNILIY